LINGTQIPETLAVGDARDEQGVPVLGHVAGDPLAELDAGVPGVGIPPHAHRPQLVVVLEKHDRAAAALEELERAREDDVEHRLEVEHRVHGPAYRRQRRQLLEPVGQGGGEDSLVHQHPRQATEVDLLLQHVKGERQAE
jgi:hypothetical protein